MKKLITFAIATLFTFLTINAQESMFNLGDKVIGLGIGFGTTLYSGNLYSRGFPPLSVTYEQAIIDEVLEKGVIGVGGYLGYTSYSWDYNSSWGYKYSNIIFGGGGFFHYPLVDKLDTYVGILLGFRISTASETGTNPGFIEYSATSSGLVFSSFIGARYYFTEKFAAFCQVGYGVSYLTIGVSLKL